MDIRIIQVILDIFDHYGESIRYDYERFENALNDEAPDLMEECYLVALGFKTGIFEAMIFDEERYQRGYVEYLKETFLLTEREAFFLVAVLETILQEMNYYFEIPNIDEMCEDAYQRHDFDQLFIIAKIYFMGFGVAQDYEKAFEIYSYLYGVGDDRGAYYLGYMYEYGYGIETDVEKAILYYQSREDEQTCFRLGILYMFGKHVVQDTQLAYDYFSKSQMSDAYFYKGLLLEESRDYAGAVASYYEGAKQFHVESMYKLAMCLRVGVGVDMDLKEAHQYFEYAYFCLHGNSTYQLAMMSFDGIVVKKDEKKAIDYLKQAALLHSQEACFTLAQFYDYGIYVQKNHRMAIEYYQKAQQVIQESRGNL